MNSVAQDTPQRRTILKLKYKGLFSKPDKADIGKQIDDVTPAARKFFGLSLEIRAKALSKIADVLELDDIEKLPAFFTTDCIRVGKVGIFEDLCERAGISLEDQKRRQVLKRAVGFFFKQWAYLEAQIHDEFRYDLDLQKYAAITEQDRKHAAGRLKSLQKRAAKNQRENTP
ncbi:ProQ/FINO family protein [Pelagibius sp. Alg239-R121]|uniref:ProQ/FINO family protein n=1 Tax=Pelagibius sp. Alg239-R121 TaxID=2993448 RepID=UPI0024A77A27|nr:ProQ/FINO family protein [Pelagibius sp. Alg239-R121]